MLYIWHKRSAGVLSPTIVPLCEPREVNHLETQQGNVTSACHRVGGGGRKLRRGITLERNRVDLASANPLLWVPQAQEKVEEL